MAPVSKLMFACLLLVAASALASAGDIKCGVGPQSHPATCLLVCGARGYEVGHCDFGVCACSHSRGASPAAPHQEALPGADAGMSELLPPILDFDGFTALASRSYPEAAASISGDLQLPVHDFGLFAVVGDLEPPKYDYQPASFFALPGAPVDELRPSPGGDAPLGKMTLLVPDYGAVSSKPDLDAYLLRNNVEPFLDDYFNGVDNW